MGILHKRNTFSKIANFFIMGLKTFFWSQKPKLHNLPSIKLTWFVFLQTLTYVLIEKLKYSHFVTSIKGGGGRTRSRKTVFAGPKRVRPTWGFSDFVRTYVRPYVRTSVRPSVSTLDFSFILHAQFTSDPQYFYRLRTSYVLTIRGADHKLPRPP